MTRRRPNIVLIITDQERSHKHWPRGWAEKNLPTYYDRLVGCVGREDRSSVSFPNAFTATTECCPSRASLLTSSYPTEHGVKTTPGSLDPRSDLGLNVVADDTDEFDVTKRQRPNLLRLLSEVQGYDVGWKGKWHLSHHFSSGSTGESSILKWYGATSLWNPPDAGHSLSHSATLGGGRKFNHDGRFLRGLKKRFDTKDENNDVAFAAVKKLVDPYHRNSGDNSDDSSKGSQDEEEEEECIFDFLAKHTLSVNDQQPSDANPFFLIASLVNPHDVWASSCFSHLTDEEFYKETGYHPSEFESIPIDLPPNHRDDLSKKPLIQRLLNRHYAFGDLSDKIDPSKGQQHSHALRYIRFYAFLHKIVDAEIGSLIDALDATGQMNNTVIIRMADHGEQALSHGLREKRNQCYEETMGIPLIINYPTALFHDADVDKKFSSKMVATSLVSSIDVLPTIAELAGIDCTSFHYRGKSLVPFLRKDTACSDMEKNHDEVLFTFDEPLAPPGVPGFIRCIRTPDFKYAVYFTIDGQVVEYEMYNLSTDPYERSNLCGMEPDDRWYYYHERLTQLMLKMGAVPSEFEWDAKTKPRRYDEYDTRHPPTMNSIMRDKNKANELFLQGNYQLAAIHYTKALQYCAELVDSDPAAEEKAKDVKLSLFLNLALAYIKLDMFDDAMLPCDDALKLDTTNVKALYRRATVLYQKHKFDDAIKDLDDAGRLAPEDKAVRKLRGLVDQEIAKQNKKQKAMALKMCV
jgi:choline-sulfatase